MQSYLKFMQAPKTFNAKCMKIKRRKKINHIQRDD